MRGRPQRATQSGYRRRATHESFVVDRTDSFITCDTFGAMSRRLELITIAVVFATIDIVYKLAMHADYHHARSRFAAFAIGAVVVGLVVFVPRVPSRIALLGAAIAAGGALGNLLSLFVWSQGVPDPIVVEGASRGIAFNLADVFAFGGDALLLSAIVVHGVRRRAHLRQPV
jgi:Signal peptidase (SPase) II